MRLKIVSERSNERNHVPISQYKVVNAETGELVDGVTAISFKLDSYGAKATLKVAVDLDVEIDDVLEV